MVFFDKGLMEQDYGIPIDNFRWEYAIIGNEGCIKKMVQYYQPLLGVFSSNSYYFLRFHNQKTIREYNSQKLSGVTYPIDRDKWFSLDEHTRLLGVIFEQTF